ncbi:MAG: 2Fe-2S iron-sulfur cluster-binding protein [Flavobacteriales bacterium]|nr:2Fe-2S iron-sulfur cluster-binding protein [Flavobacteriales bacterium]
MKILDLKLAKIDRLTADSVKLSFDTQLMPEFAYQAGQYVTLCFNIKGEEVRRAYSICSTPGDQHLSVAVKEVKHGLVSTHINRSVMPGEHIRVMVPQGHFTFSPDASKERHIVLFGAGSGITPLISILKTTLAQEPNSRVTLFYGNRRKDSIMFYDELESLGTNPNVNIYHILSEDSGQQPLFAGRINFGKTLELVYNFANDSLEKTYYICGPGEMMISTKDALIDSGVDAKSVRMEYFENPDLKGKASEPIAVTAPAPVPSNGMSEVHVHLDGNDYTFNLATKGKTLLEAAISNGADAPFSCRGGVCTTCRAQIKEGTVSMDSNLSLTDDEIEEGYILTCQSHPTSAVVRISYDD